MTTDQHAVPGDAELAKMSRQEKATAGLAADHVELDEYGPVAVPGSPADKRNERGVALWFVLAALLGLLFAVAFIWWPHEYVPAYQDGQLAYALYTPIIGLTMGGAILCSAARAEMRSRLLSSNAQPSASSSGRAS